MSLTSTMTLGVTAMKTKTAFRILSILCVAIAATAVPQTAMAAIIEHAGAAVQWLDEMAIVAIVVGAAVALDMSSWSLMTNKR